MGPQTARRFAWLLRPDVRKATRSEEAPNEAFEAWWLVRGRQEYPACAELSEAERTWLREPVGQLRLGGQTLPLPRALQLVLSWRPDVRQTYGDNAMASAAWFFSTGLHDHLLLPLVDEAWVRALDAPAAVAAGQPGAPASPGGPALAPQATLLMALSWQLLEPARRAELALEDPVGRLRFMALFFEAVGQSPSLQALLARRWHAWLQQDSADLPVGGAEGAGSLAGAAGGGAGMATGPLQPRWKVLGLGSRRVPGLAQGAGPGEGAPQDAPPGQPPAWLGRPAAELAARARPWLRPAGRTPAPPSWRERPFGVNLYGYAFGELGIGEDLRMAVQACEAAGVPHRVLNVDPGSQLRQADTWLSGHVQRSNAQEAYAFNLFCLPAFDMVGRLLMREGAQLLQGHCNIGWWPWELPVWPRRWAGAFELVDEVWAATRYTQAMYQQAGGRPVPLMPLPVAVDRMQPCGRAALGLPEQRFLYLFVFDFNSRLTRKNPWAVIEAFQRAYPPPRNRRERRAPAEVGLVMKAMNGRSTHPGWEAFKLRCAADPRIVLLEETLDRPQLLGLVAACDAYVSLHRAEGFGRTLAEAMLLGKPVVATDFSGNTDFLMPHVGFPVQWSRREVGPEEYLFVEPEDGAWWAEPDTENAGQQMRAARAAAGDAEFMARLKAHATAQFAPERIGERMRERLQALWAGAATPKAREAEGP